MTMPTYNQLQNKASDAAQAAAMQVVGLWGWDRRLTIHTKTRIAPRHAFIDSGQTARMAYQNSPKKGLCMTVTLKNITREQLDVIKESIEARRNYYQSKAESCAVAWTLIFKAKEEKDGDA